MATWSDLARELDAWDARGRSPDLWVRDDDATAPVPALDQLLALAGTHEVPVHLAVIPSRLDPALAPRLSTAGTVVVLQHGYAHLNHEPGGAGASEFGDTRATAAIRADLAAGRAAIAAAALPHAEPIFAAPWNRLGTAAFRELKAVGFRIVSTAYPRARAFPVPELLQVNVHMDPIRWKTGRPLFRGTENALHGLIDHLSQRRGGTVDAAEPTGIGTHHRDLPPEAWDFLASLFERVRGRVRWIRLPDLLTCDRAKPDCPKPEL